MKLHKNKKRGITVFLFIGIIGTIVFPLSKTDIYKPVREEIELFYKTELVNCVIVSTIEKKYPGAGNYSLFKVDCSNKYFPILLKNLTKEKKKWFNENTIINKKKNSFNIELSKNNKSVIFQIQEKEFRSLKKANLITRLSILSWTMVIVILLLLMPNKLFDMQSNQ